MLGRRAFLQSTAALPVLLLGRSLPAAQADVGGADVAIADLRLDGSGAFAAAARAAGLPPLQFASDAAGVWMRELEPRLRAAPVAIAGYTSAATLFCLELMARDYGARLVERRDSGGGVAWVLSSRPLRRAALAPSDRSIEG